MKLGKIIFVLFVFSIIFSCLKIYAQDSNLPKQIKILNNFGAIPFEDGKTVVAGVAFTGLDVDYTQSVEDEEKLLTEKRLVRALREQRAMIKANEEYFDGYKVVKTAKTIREWLARNGYDRADVVVTGEKLRQNQMKLIFSINRGRLARVSEIVFEGNVNLTNEELAADFKQCRKIDWEIFDAGKYDYIARKCSLSLMHRNGYFKPKIQNINRRLGEDGYVVTVKVQEGARYRIGDVKIEGAKVFNNKEILEMSGQKTGEVADGEKLRDFVFEKLKTLYGDKGYVLYNAEFDPDFIEPQAEGLDGIVNLTITIDEGKQFKMFRLKFNGVDAETEKRLKGNFAIKEGEIYNQSKFGNAIKKINETEEFAFIDEQNIDFMTDEENGDIYITVYLKK